jgi:hypothetical protein
VISELQDPLLNPICAANEIGPVPITLENSERNLPEVLMVSYVTGRLTMFESFCNKFTLFS